MHSLLLLFSLTAAQPPQQRLLNAADPGTLMSFTGVGTGDHAPNGKESTCGFYCGLTNTWLHMGGSRVDSADSYGNEVGVGLGIQASGRSRESVFIVSKVGPGGYNFPLGYQDALNQIQAILKNYSTSFVDLMLIHSPVPPSREAAVVPRIDPLCMLERTGYNATACRLSTWKALVESWKNKQLRAIGVSNYDQAQLAEIELAGMPLPAVNQVFQNPLKPQWDLLQYCNNKGIAIQAYGSFGGDNQTGPVLSNPTIVKIAQTHNASASQVVLNWQYRLNISFNPGFSAVPSPPPFDVLVEYMRENLNFNSFTLSDEEMKAINALGE